MRHPAKRTISVDGGSGENGVKQQDTDWFRPLWRRIAVVAFVAGWCGWEWFNGDSFWALLTTAALAYAVWALFVSFDAGAGRHDDDRP